MQFNIIKDLFLLVESLHPSNTDSLKNRIIELRTYREKTNEEVLARARTDTGDSGGKFWDLCTKDCLDCCISRAQITHHCHLTVRVVTMRLMMMVTIVPRYGDFDEAGRGEIPEFSPEPSDNMHKCWGWPQ